MVHIHQGKQELHILDLILENQAGWLWVYQDEDVPSQYGRSDDWCGVAEYRPCWIIE